MKTKELFEKYYVELVKALNTGDYSIAPFPLIEDEAFYYLQGKRDVLLWVLEMYDV